MADLPIWPSGIARLSDGILDYWVEPEHEAALNELVAAVRAEAGV